jgi:hypothetical protein
MKSAGRKVTGAGIPRWGKAVDDFVAGKSPPENQQVATPLRVRGLLPATERYFAELVAAGFGT